MPHDADEPMDELTRLRLDEQRLRALTANVPGVLFQMCRRGEEALGFCYVSGATQLLLNMESTALQRLPDSLLSLIVAEDRARFWAAFNAAEARLATLNWEGRVLPPGSEEKWVNLRCAPRRLEDGGLAWEGVMWNITQSKQAERELRSSRRQLAALSNHLQKVKEAERDRISRDIHDVLGGTLVGIKFSSALLLSKLEQDSPLRERMQQIVGLVDEAISTAGRVARELRPGILREFGLAAAVESYAEDFTQRTMIPCRVLCADHDIESSEELLIALFRTYQETLTNVSKHARATEVQVRLMQEGEDVVLEVADNGRGIAEVDLAKPKSFGLRSIRERLHAFGGTMEIRPRDTGGSRVILRAPLQPPNWETSTEGVFR